MIGWGLRPRQAQSREASIHSDPFPILRPQPMLLLITAAGEGFRFRQAGFTVPKPLIRVHGRTLLEHTLAAMALTRADHLLIAVQRRNGIPAQLAGRLQAMLQGVALRWLELDQLLPGQLATAVAALEMAAAADSHGLDPWPEETPLLIHNCDTGFAWNDALLPGEGAYGSMAVFEAEGEHWSFGRPAPDDPNRAVEIAEKRRISPWASIGLYGFRSLGDFLADARAHLGTSPALHGEYYVAPLLQAALLRGETVQLPKVSAVRTYGTPEELCACFGLSLAEVLAENTP